MSVLDNLKLGRHALMNSGAITGGLYFGQAANEEITHRRQIEEVIDFLELQTFDIPSRNTSVWIAKTC